jgi:hypothetical protein
LLENRQQQQLLCPYCANIIFPHCSSSFPQTHPTHILINSTIYYSPQETTLSHHHSIRVCALASVPFTHSLCVFHIAAQLLLTLTPESQSSTNHAQLYCSRCPRGLDRLGVW